MSLSVRVAHHFAGAEIDIDFTVASPGITVLFGPSGAGKSSVLMAAAGLLRPELCRIECDGETIADTAAGVWPKPERRGVGLVFQDTRLFPHMSVATNLRYGLRRARTRGIAFDAVVEVLGIGALLARRPHTLSGGEAQRVAIGRALLAQPRLLLMDEPLASLDDARKAEILPYLAALRATLRLPVLYVTHALDELVRLAQSVVLIEAGRVTAVGSLADIAARGDVFLGLRDDAGAVLTCHVAGHDAARQLTRLDIGQATILVPLIAMEVGRVVRVKIPAREVILAARQPESISVQNALAGVVRAVTADLVRHAALVEVVLGAQTLLARVTPDAVERLGLAPGGRVIALFKSVGVEVIA